MKGEILSNIYDSSSEISSILYYCNFYFPLSLIEYEFTLFGQENTSRHNKFEDLKHKYYLFLIELHKNMIINWKPTSKNNIIS